MELTQIVGNEDEKSKINREKWGSKTEYLLSCIGYAIGIGNVWRFPYLCYRNGGGAFLVPYLLMLFLCGVPLFYMETNLGQFTSSSCVTVFKIAPLLKGAGFAMVVVSIICTSYYNVIMTYPIMFIVRSFNQNLPWKSCNNPWNSDKCLLLSDQNHANQTLLDGTSSSFKTPADEFFHNEILQISDGIGNLGGIVWSLFAGDIFVWIVMYLCIMNGIKSTGKVVYFTATFPFIILTILFIRGITLPGAMEGVKFYITPKWHLLKDIKVWTDAASQIFYSLGPGWGGIVNMSSYNKFRNNTRWDSIFVPIINCSTSIFAGFVVFSVLGFMSEKTGIPVEKVATGGPGLAFVTYPEAIAMMPFSNFFAIIFFFMLFLLGIDSCFVQLEAVISAITEEYPQFRGHKKKITGISILFMGILSFLCVTRAGMYIVQLMDWYSAAISIILICLVEVIAISWIYGVNKFIQDIEFMIGHRPGLWWFTCWKYITPSILIMIFISSILFTTEITYSGKLYPKWAITVGWISCFSSIICIPLYFIIGLRKYKGSLLERIKIGCRAVNYEPADENYRREYQQMLHQKQYLH